MSSKSKHTSRVLLRSEYGTCEKMGLRITPCMLLAKARPSALEREGMSSQGSKCSFSLKSICWRVREGSFHSLKRVTSDSCPELRLAFGGTTQMKESPVKDKGRRLLCKRAHARRPSDPILLPVICICPCAHSRTSPFWELLQGGVRLSESRSPGPAALGAPGGWKHRPRSSAPGEPGTVPHRPPHALSRPTARSRSQQEVSLQQPRLQVFFFAISIVSALFPSSLRPRRPLPTRAQSAARPAGPGQPDGEERSAAAEPRAPLRPVTARLRRGAAARRTEPVLRRTFRRGRGGEGTTRPPLRGPAKGARRKKKKRFVLTGGD